MGHKTPSMAGVKSTVGLILPATDGVASMLSTRWHFSIWPCHRLARAGVHHFHAGRACECLHPHLTAERAASDNKDSNSTKKQRLGWSEVTGYQLNKSFFSDIWKTKKIWRRSLPRHQKLQLIKGSNQIQFPQAEKPEHNIIITQLLF